MMKKTIMIAAMAIIGMGNVSAQQNGQDREQMRTEMIAKAAERQAENFKLKGDKREAFMETFKQYQTEMFSTNQPRPREDASQEEENLTDEQAAAKLEENFARQAQQIETMQKRLDIQKKYAPEFAKVLTPQQVLKVMAQPRGGQGQRPGQAQRGGQRGPGGEGGYRRGGQGGFGGGPRGGFGGGDF